MSVLRPVFKHEQIHFILRNGIDAGFDFLAEEHMATIDLGATRDYRAPGILPGVFWVDRVRE